MSNTVVYGFGKDGTVKSSIDIKNAWHGAMAVWTILEEKYLPSLPKPEWAVIMKEPDRYWSRTKEIFEDKMQDVWDLAKDSRLTFDEKIVLLSTFDNVLIKRENIDRLIKAFRNFNGETSLLLQVKAIKKIVKDEDVLAIGFNQTSIGYGWDVYNYDDEIEESTSYNCLTQDKHWWLFNESGETNEQ